MTCTGTALLLPFYCCEQVRPLIPELQNFQLHLASSPVVGSASLSTACNTTESNLTTIDPQQCLTVDSSDLSANTVQVLGVYTTQLHTVSPALPAALLVGDDNIPSTESSGDENSDVDIDIWHYHQQTAPPGDWKITSYLCGRFALLNS